MIGKVAVLEPSWCDPTIRGQGIHGQKLKESHRRSAEEYTNYISSGFYIQISQVVFICHYFCLCSVFPVFIYHISHVQSPFLVAPA
jgi:hypothetical protein